MISHSERETTEYAKKYARTLSAGDVVLLEGEMGAGKTVFVKGLAQGLGIEEEITSPTYAYMNDYGGVLYHYDCYRLKSGAQAEALGLCDYFYANAGKDAGDGFYFAIPNPAKGGAMKRMWMFLRWMIRKSSVDLGVWKFMTPAQLKIPMDVHVARMSRELGLLKRNSNDKKAVDELTNYLRTLDPEDPVKYDFALFGYGVNNK